MRPVSLPPDPRPILMKLDIGAALSPGTLPVVFTIFVMAFVDTVGTLIGLSARAGLLDERGNLPDIERPMLADALATTVAPLLGTTTTGAYIESAAGIEEGGKTGFVCLVVSLLFLLSLFLAPVLTAVPPHVYGSVLVVIGIFMIEPVTRIDFRDRPECGSSRRSHWASISCTPTDRMERGAVGRVRSSSRRRSGNRGRE